MDSTIKRQGLQFVRRLSEWGSTLSILFECSNGSSTPISGWIQLPNGWVVEVETLIKLHWEWFLCQTPTYRGIKPPLPMLQTIQTKNTMIPPPMLRKRYSRLL